MRYPSIAHTIFEQTADFPGEDDADFAPKIVPEAYNREPFCDPESANFDPTDVVINYDPKPHANAFSFGRYAKYVYLKEKAGSSQGEAVDKVPGIDLHNAEHLAGLQHHVLTHTVTGLSRFGTSNTTAIPYWDREAAIVGMVIQNPAGAKETIRLQDALSINSLRTFAELSVDRTAELYESHMNLTVAHSRGQQTRRDISEAQQQEHTSVMAEWGLFSEVAVAKLKHLLWLVDQQPDETLRHHMLPELAILTDRLLRSGIDEDLILDMGVDTGISEDTKRPAYDISAFAQLSHLGQTTYSLPQQVCHRIDYRAMLSNIARSGSDVPFYEDDSRYHLPWNMEIVSRS